MGFVSKLTISDGLSWAANNMEKRLLANLLARGADISIADEQGNTPLHTAVTRGATVHELGLLLNPQLAQKLLKEYEYPKHNALTAISHTVEDKRPGLCLGELYNPAQHWQHMENRFSISPLPDKIVQHENSKLITEKMNRQGKSIIQLAAERCQAPALMVFLLHQVPSDVDLTIRNSLSGMKHLGDHELGSLLLLATANLLTETSKVLLQEAKLRRFSKDDKCILLSMAIERGSDGVAELLLTHFEADPEAQDRRGKTPLALAVEYNNLRMVKFLLEGGYSVNVATSLNSAMTARRLDIVEQFLAADTGLQSLKQQGTASTPLHLACEKGLVDSVKLLLEDRIVSAGWVDLDAMDESGYTPLHLACRHGHCNVASLLLEDRLVSAGKVDPGRETKDGVTALWLACEGRHFDIADILLEDRLMRYHKVFPNQGIRWREKGKYSPLGLAAKTPGGTKTVRRLLDMNPPRFQPDERYVIGRTPFHLACKENQVESAWALWKTGQLDPEYKADKGGTILNCAENMLERLKLELKNEDWEDMRECKDVVEKATALVNSMEEHMRTKKKGKFLANDRSWS